MNDDIECPLTANPCRHCSNEHEYRPYMKLDKDPRTGLYKPGGLGKLEIGLGHRCNNACCWIDKLETCPMTEDLINQQDMIEEYNTNVEKERVKAECKIEREKAKKKAKGEAVKKKPVGKVVKKVVEKPVKKVVAKKVVKKPIKKVVKKPVAKKQPITKPTKKKDVTKGVTKRKL